MRLVSENGEIDYDESALDDKSELLTQTQIY